MPQQVTRTSAGRRVRQAIARAFLLIALALALVLGACEVEIVAPTVPATPRPVITSTPSAPGAVATVEIEHGFGAVKGWWQVYFTDPPMARTPAPTSGGIDTVLVEAINNTQRTLDIAAFEWDNIHLTRAVLDAHARGVTVRVVADNEHTIEKDSSTIGQLEAAGIPIVYDNRSGLMHNKFMIMDSQLVWTGATNFTMNGVYRNNNNLLGMRSQRAVQVYQQEFNEMFLEGRFGPRGNNPKDTAFTQNGTIVRILFSPDDEVIDAITNEITAADEEVIFMAFSFTEEEIGNAILRTAARGVHVEGVFELRGSETQFSRLRTLYCAGLDVRQDGNPSTMHHKVFVIDRERVITGSFNFSVNATRNNDENMVIIYDRDLAAQFLEEYERVKAVSRVPSHLECN